MVRHAVKTDGVKSLITPTARGYGGPSCVNMISYDRDSFTREELTTPASLKGKLGSSGVTWISFTGPPKEIWLDFLEEEIGIHPLVLEDILGEGQRPTMEEFDEYLFITLKTFFRRSGSEGVFTQQMNIVLAKDFVLTFQDHPNNVFDEVIGRIQGGKGRIRGMGTDYLLYRLIGSIVDSYFLVIEQVGDIIEKIEDRLMEEPEEQLLYDIHSLKRDMIFLRRSLWPMREVLSSLTKDRTMLITEDTEVYFRDIYNHTIQVIDTSETFRDMLSGMLDLYLSSLSNKMNEVMKVLTIIATIFIPLTFVAGIYGMNFDPDASPLNMPELGWYFGYPLTMGAMLTIAMLMLLFFRRKKWI